MSTRRQKDSAQAPRQMTRGQLSRHEREQRQIRQFTLAMIGVGALVVLILGAAFVNQAVIQPNAEVGKVYDQSISRAMYNKFRAWTIYNQLRLLQFYSQQQTDQTQVSQYSTQITTLQQELQGLDTWPTIDSSTLQQLADNILTEQKAGEVGVTLSDAEVLAAARKSFEPQPTPIPGPSDTPGPTETPTATGTPPTETTTATGTPPTATPSVTATATHTRTPGPSPTATSTPTITNTPLPVPGADKTAESDYSTFLNAITRGSRPTSGYCSLGCPGLSQQDYQNLVIKPDELKKKITAKLGESVPTTREEVHAQHILIAPVSQSAEDDAAAKKKAEDIKARLDKGEDFAKLAAEFSTDTSNKDNGGDLGWFAATADGGPMVQEFSDAAFKLTKPGEISAPVKSQFGYHIIRLIERGPRPLDTTALDQAKSKAFDDWLKKKKDEAGTKIHLQIPATATPVPTQAPPTELPAPTSAATASVPLTSTPTAAPTSPTP